VFVDTNVLIYASFPELPLAQMARTRMSELKDADVSFWASRQVLREFLAVATRPGTLKASSPIAEIVGSIRTWENQLTIADEDTQVTQHLLAFLENPGARGKQVHDANIAATMRCHAIPYLLTHNMADFARYAPWVTALPLVP
jgi:predicted nucleic acid-binding protein